MSDMMKTVGKWAFLAGVVIAIVAGFVTLNTTLASVLMGLGLLVGLLNVSPKEAHGFLLAAVSLVIVASLGGQSFATIQTIGPAVQRVFGALLSFVVPATIVVALAAIFDVARD